MSITTMIWGRAIKDAASGVAGASVKAVKMAGKGYSKIVDNKAVDWASAKLDKIGSKAMDHANIISYTEDGIPKGFNKKGLTLIAGSTALASAVNMANEDERVHLGTTDGKIRTATPDYSVYRQGSTLSAPGGADGSLVFALDKTKNGGFL